MKKEDLVVLGAVVGIIIVVIGLRFVPAVQKHMPEGVDARVGELEKRVDALEQRCGK